MAIYKPCLVIVFNHKFDKNIEKLERLYSSRFEHIFFLIPFYTGNNPRVIPVYESSFYFQGYFAQGYRTFYRPEFTHYFFIGDDLILNPDVNENNYAQLLGLDEETSYLPDLCPLHKAAQSLNMESLNVSTNKTEDNYWWHTFKGITFYENRKGSQTEAELPSREEAVQLFTNNGIDIKPLSYYNVFGPLKFPSSIRAGIETGKKLWTYYKQWQYLKVSGHPQKLQLQYPLVYSYSDIAVVSSQVVQRFCHLCGVLSAMGLFVEMALPTALLLSGGRIITDAQAGLKGLALWGATDIVALETKYSLDLSALLADFPAKQFYFHPIKLSRWR